MAKARTAIVTLQLTVRYDKNQATEDEICEALTTLLNTAVKTPDVLSEVGNPSVSDFSVGIGDDANLDDDLDDDEEQDDDGSG